MNIKESLEDLKWVDTHCHIQLMGKDFKEEDIFNLEYLIIPGVNVESSQRAKQMSQQIQKNAFWSAGLHPHEADSFHEIKEELSLLMEEADLIGETGLDYYRNLSPRKQQIESLQFHLQVAHKMNKPIILHCRDSFSDMYDLLSSSTYRNKIILHSWTGGNNWTKKFVELDVYFSISGIVTYITAHDLHQSVQHIPIERLLLETDVPYLTPEPYKGKKNIPSNIMYTAKKLSELLSIPLKELSDITIANTNKLMEK